MYVVDEQADWDSKRTFASVSASVSVLRSFAFLISRHAYHESGGRVPHPHLTGKLLRSKEAEGLV